MKRISLAVTALGTIIMVRCAGTGSGELEPAASHQAENQTVRSADGTRIGFTRVGSGTVPVLIVHGSLNSGEQWMPVATALAEQCTCYVMDRWGRGGSEDHADYSLEREVEDIGAILEVAGPEAYLLGHSSGAIYALEAARRFPVAGLILYEPPLHSHGAEFARMLDRIRVAAREERFDDAVSIFLREEARLPEEDLSLLKKTPRWEHMVRLLPQSVREWEELVEIAPRVDRYRNMGLPTLLLTGTQTKDHPSFATEALEDMLPKARTAMLEGQAHGAHVAAPEMVAKTAAKFVLETSR